jgi:hypothetical protein
MVADNEGIGIVYDPVALDHLAKFIRVCENVGGMTDEELSDAVHAIWARFPVGTVEDALLSEILSRFDELAGIIRDEP